MKQFDPAMEIQDKWVFGEFGGVNPSITDSATYTFMKPGTMKESFHSEIEGCYLYSRHWNPINKYLCDTLAKMEGTESALVTASGMSAISCSILQICQTGDEFISSRTVYGGTYALFKNFFPRLGITVKFVDITDHEAVKEAMSDKTKLIYTEALSNPLLEIANIPELSKLAHDNDMKLVVDNTFTPMIFSPAKHGADIVVYSMTKFMNGHSDCVAGCLCASKEFTNELTDVHSGASMLLGPVLDSFRASGILKNIHTLHIRMKQHSKNAQYLSEKLEADGYKVIYPGLESHRHNGLMKELMNDEFGFGGMMVLDAQTEEKADELMNTMQEEKVGYLAVSLGFFKTLFSSPGTSTSSEIPEEEHEKMGLSHGLIRMSVGLDNDIDTSYQRIKTALKKVNL